MPATEFSDDLHKRVLAFQRDHGLAPDGRLTTDDWTKLAEVAATAADTPAEPAAEPVVVAEPAVAPVAAVVVKPAGPNPADFPVLYDIVTHCQDEESAKAYLLATTGFDVDEIVGHISAVLEEAGA